jgi:pimeloyl-ACP methyl ester carboxylesterase
MNQVIPPRIQYAAKPHGESVALCSVGSGYPLVVVPSGPWATIEIQWAVPAWRSWNERLAAHQQLVLYDPSGAGLSEMSASGPAFTLETRLTELYAVVEKLGLEQLALFAAQHAGPIAIAFAARHPELVSHLVLWCTYSRGQDYLGEPRSEAVHHVLGDDWELFTETVAHAQLGWSEGESASRIAALLREHLTPAIIAAVDAAAGASDVTSLMPLVRAPALVLHRRQLRHPDLAISRRLAAGLPNASLVILEGDSVAPFSGDVEAASCAKGARQVRARS